MITSGITNGLTVKNYQNGSLFPSSRNGSRYEKFARPYVDGIDTGIPTITTHFENEDLPSAVLYRKLFGKKLTPDEQLYNLMQAQEKFDKMIKGKKIPFARGRTIRALGAGGLVKPNLFVDTRKPPVQSFYVPKPLGEEKEIDLEKEYEKFLQRKEEIRQDRLAEDLRKQLREDLSLYSDRMDEDPNFTIDPDAIGQMNVDVYPLKSPLGSTPSIMNVDSTTPLGSTTSMSVDEAPLTSAFLTALQKQAGKLKPVKVDMPETSMASSDKPLASILIDLQKQAAKLKPVVKAEPRLDDSFWNQVKQKAQERAQSESSESRDSWGDSSRRSSVVSQPMVVEDIVDDINVNRNINQDVVQKFLKRSRRKAVSPPSPAVKRSIDDADESTQKRGKKITQRKSSGSSMSLD